MPLLVERHEDEWGVESAHRGDPPEAVLRREDRRRIADHARMQE